MRPKVSVLMSVRNGERFLGECIRSVLDQSFTDFEFLIADDMSTDGTASLLCRYVREDKRIRLVVNYGGMGLTKSLNKLIGEATGEYIARIDADDIARGDRLFKQLESFREDTVMSTSCYRVVDQDGRPLYSHCPEQNPMSLKWSLIFRNNIRHSTVMWKRDVGLGYNEKYRYSQDYDMWCRMSGLGEIVVVPEPLADIRSHESAITSDKREEQDKAAAEITAGRFLHYTGKTLNIQESEGLRLVCHLKDDLQFRQMIDMSEENIRKSILLYMEVLESFCIKERANEDWMTEEAGKDIRPLLDSDHTRRMVREVISEQRSSCTCLEKIATKFL